MAIGLEIVSLTLGLFFVCSGSLKLTPQIHEPSYKELRSEFKGFVKVFPFAEQTHWKPSVSDYVKCYSVAEVVCGLLLLLPYVPLFLKNFANVILLGLVSHIGWSHFALGHQIEKCSSCLVFGLFLMCRIILVGASTTPVKKKRE